MKISNKILSFLIIIILLFMTIGCAGLGKPIAKPEVTVIDIQIIEMRPLEAEFLLFLRIINSNPFPLDLSGLSCNLKIDGKHFATGISNKHLQIPAFDSKVVSVKVYASTLQMFSSIMNIIHNQGMEQKRSRLFAYELNGTIQVERTFQRTVNFKSRGELFLPGSSY